MRRRSEVEAAKAEQRVEQRYFKCPKCELVQSEASLDQGAGEDQVLCVSCATPINFERDLHKNGAAAKSAPKIADAKPSVEAPKCETCGKPLTVTSIGLFYPCGHTKPKDEEPKAASADDFVEKTTAPVTHMFEKAVRPKEPAGPPPKPFAPVRETVDGSVYRDLPGGPKARKLRVVWGEELYAPIQYNNFKVGPFEMEVEVPDGADPEAVYKEAMAFLRKCADASFEERLASFLAKAAKAKVR